MVPDQIVDEPASVKLVWIALADAEETTQKRLREETGIDRDTVRAALERLQAAELAVEAGRDPMDLRTVRWRAEPASSPLARI